MTTRKRRPAPILLLLGVFLGLAAPLARAQFTPPQAPAPRKSYSAPRINPRPPVIDGKLDDAAWAGSGWEGGFIQNWPYEGREPSQTTEFKILYDDDAVYIAVRAHDTRPVEIERRISRRDNCNGDSVSVAIDSLFDHLTAYVFRINACGVKADQIIVNGGMDHSDEHDMSWDPIWDAAAAIGPDGWAAEMRIPFSQIRFGKKDQQVWGLQVSRYLFRLGEESEWQPIPRTAPGYVHLYGELHGLRGLAAPHQIEITPYTVGRLKTYRAEAGNPFATGRDSSLVGGLDGKLGVTSDLTMNFTVNPDFGQVEADPSVVNLTGYETYFEEKRPFFVEGRNILDYQLVGGEGESSSDNLFYSRRIGRNPHYEPSTSTYLEMPEAASILGAFKLTGKTRSGLSIGLLESLTGRESALLSDGGPTYDIPVEPMANFLVLRAQQDFRHGATTLGGMLTAVKRDIKDAHLGFLHNAAYTGGLDFLHTWRNKTYFLSFKAIYSRVEGSPAAILETQLSSVHYFQRPDAGHVELDPTRTSLSGTGGAFEIGKQGGGPWQYVAGFNWRSPGLELNDVGFLRAADQLTQYLWASYQLYEPAGIFRNYTINLNQRATWNFGGVNTSKGGGVNAWGQFKNYWSAGLGLGYNGRGLSQGALRGGPLLRQAPSLSLWFNVSTDNRRKVRFSLNGSGTERTNGDSQYWSIRPQINIIPSAAMTLSLGPMFSANRSVLQYVETPVYGAENRYIFGAIDQTTVGLTIRLNYSLTPDLSIQLYGMPFVSAGDYSAFKRITDSRSADLAARYRIFGTDELTFDPAAQVYAVDENGDGVRDYSFSNPEFNFRELRSNLVIRWEYVPGSTLYIVWSQGRTGSVADGAFNLRRDLDELFGVHPSNAFLVKFSYCFQL